MTSTFIEVAYEVFSYELNMISADGPKIQLSQVSSRLHILFWAEHYREDILPEMSYLM